MQLEGADEQLEPFGLEQDAAGGGEGVVALVDGAAVDADGDRLAGAQAFDLRPLPQGALDVLLAARVEQLLEVGVVARPPELAAVEDARRAALIPARLPVGADGDVAGELHGNDLLLGVPAADGDEVADTALGELALDGRHPGAGPAVRPGGVQE